MTSSASAYTAPVIRTLDGLCTSSPQRAVVTRPRGSSTRVTWSHAQLTDAVRQTQRHLVECVGLRPGGVLAMSLVNGAEFVAAFLGCTNSRGIAAPLNHAYTEAEVDFYLKDMQCQALLVEKGQSEVARRAARACNIPIYDIATHTDATGQVRIEFARAANQSANLKSQPAAPTKGGALPIAQEDDIALIFHTSGTTGRPKAVPLTHRNICRTLTNICGTFRLTSQDACLVVMPLFHVHGLMACLLSSLVSGGCAVIPEKFSAHSFWQEFDETECTWYSAVPTIHQILLALEAKQSSAPRRRRLKFIRSCSSALAPATWEQLEKSFGVPIIESYAMSEASHQMTSNELPPGKRKPGSVGRGQGVEVAILDDAGNELPRGREGEICVRGSNVTRGYLNNSEANAASFTKTGFFRTGDQGTMDADGFVYITGRLKELINRGGEKIAPLEIDAVLLSHPAVAEAIAFAQPDEKYGQEVAAAIVPKHDVWERIKSDPRAQEELTQQLQAHVKKQLSAFKAPKSVFYNDVLPKTATGKIQRRNVASFFLDKEKKHAGDNTKIKSKL